MQGVFKEGMLRFERENLSEAIINRGKEFDWEKNAVRYLEVYKSLY
jgi:hypothetical protein